jgi:bacterioferritin-associated ferredoxin
MYICLCNAVTDRDIRRAVACGITSMRGLRDELGCAGDCAKCARHARDVRDEALAESSREVLSPAMGMTACPA